MARLIRLSWFICFSAAALLIQPLGYMVFTIKEWFLMAFFPLLLLVSVRRTAAGAGFAGFLLTAALITGMQLFFIPGSGVPADRLYWLVYYLLLAAVGLTLKASDGISVPEPHKLLVAATVAAVLLSLVSWLQLLAPGFFLGNLEAYGKAAVFSLMGNTNALAFFLSAILTVLVSQLVSQPMPRKKLVINAAGALLILSAIILTRSRTVFLGLFLSLGLAAVVFLRNRLRNSSVRAGKIIFRLLPGIWLAGALCALAGIMILAPGGRLYIWLTSLEITGSNLLTGVGFGGFAKAIQNAQVEIHQNTGQLPASSFYITDAHNQFLHMFTEGGLLVGVIFFILMVLSIYRVYQTSGQDQLIKAVLLTQITVWMMFNTVLQYPPVGLAVVAVLAWVWKEQKGLPVSPPRLARLRMISAAIICVLMAGWGVKTLLFRGLANSYAGSAFRQMKSQNFSSARLGLTRAVRFWPESGRLHDLLAHAWYYDGYYFEALAESEKASELDANPGILYLQAEALGRLRRFGDSIRLYERLAVILPEHISPVFMLAQLYEQSGWPEKALFYYRKGAQMKLPAANRYLDQAEFRQKQEFCRNRLRLQR